MTRYVISLCDYTGKFVEPWVEAGYTAILVDPQHEDTGEGSIVKCPGTVLEATPVLGALLLTNRIAFIAGFPPCTDVAVSGARWWGEKRAKDPYFQAKAAIVAEQCRMLGLLAGCPWMFENPVSAFSSIFGPPQHTFHPHHYTAYCADDNYVKTTCLWTGGGFVMPPPVQNLHLAAPDTRIWQAPPGPERANFRSATPLGFARAVFKSNHKG